MGIPISKFKSDAAEVYAALGTISKSGEAAGLDKPLLELVKIRASQLNGCIYCLQFHCSQARAAGVSQARLDQLPAWKESSLYSERERAALAWTERLTLQSGHKPGAAERAKVLEQFSDQELTFLTVAIGLINFWNRVNVGLGVEAPGVD
jgi:AhpD family alkylhydroperoxidase